MRSNVKVERGLGGYPRIKDEKDPDFIRPIREIRVLSAQAIIKMRNYG